MPPARRPPPSRCRPLSATASRCWPSSCPTPRVEKPAKNLVPVKRVTLEITGPDRAEVLALRKKIDRKAFETLLDPVMK